MKVSLLGQEWRHIPLLSDTLEVDAGGPLSSRLLPDLHREFQDSLGHMEKPCLEEKKREVKGQGQGQTTSLLFKESLPMCCPACSDFICTHI